MICPHRNSRTRDTRNETHDRTRWTSLSRLSCLVSRVSLVCLALLGGCQTFRGNTATNDAAAKIKTEPATSSAAVAPPTKYPVRVSQYYFFADFEIKPDLPLFHELSDLREQVVRELQLPTSNTVIQVYLFEDREKYDRFMKYRYPDLPNRRAFFVAQPRTVGAGDDLLVYTFWGDRVRQDLRHELTHALLHCVLKDVPLWLDEGLAEYFELPPGTDGVNPQHLELIRKGPFSPDLTRLEQMHQVAQMSPAEYREAWAWVHLMLRGSAEGKAALLAYLQQLRVTPSPGPLQPRLAAAIAPLNETLNTHLTHIVRTQAARR
jgi:hypothetical protein